MSVQSFILKSEASLCSSVLDQYEISAAEIVVFTLEARLYFDLPTFSLRRLIAKRAQRAYSLFSASSCDEVVVLCDGTY